MRYHFTNAGGRTCCRSHDVNNLCGRCQARARGLVINPACPIHGTPGLVRSGPWTAYFEPVTERVPSPRSLLTQSPQSTGRSLRRPAAPATAQSNSPGSLNTVPCETDLYARVRAAAKAVRR